MHTPALDTSACWEWRATGTIWRIHHSGQVSGDAAQRIAALVARHESLWSRFRPGSEVSRLNAASGEPVTLSSETIALLAACNEWYRRTGGVFQPLVGRALREWGYEVGMGRGPSGTEYSPLSRSISGAIEVDVSRRTARIPEGELIDLGGIGKGWIADLCREPLAEATDDTSVLLDAGGELVAVRGCHAMAVVHNGALCGSVTLREGEAVATSGLQRAPLGERRRRRGPSSDRPGHRPPRCSRARDRGRRDRRCRRRSRHVPGAAPRRGRRGSRACARHPCRRRAACIAGLGPGGAARGLIRQAVLGRPGRRGRRSRGTPRRAGSSRAAHRRRATRSAGRRPL